MRLALITPGYAAADEVDFAIPALTDTVRRLAARHDVHIFTLRYPHQRAVYTLHGATVHAFGWGRRGGLSRLSLLRQALAALRREHRRQSFDLFHGLWADEPGFLAVVAGRLLHRPAVVSILGGELVGFPDIGYGGQLSRANRWLTDRALRDAATVTVGSHYLRAIAAPHVAGPRLRVLPLGVDAALFTPQPSVVQPAATAPFAFHVPPGAGSPVHLLHVASLSPVKDQSVLLDALAIVANRHPAVHLNLVGAGPLEAALGDQATRLGISDRVAFHGAVAHHRLPDYYRAADLFVLSSRYESQSLAALEAAACGCPLVATAVGVLPELLEPDLTAPPGDAPALALAISRLLDDLQRCREAGRAARAQVLVRYSLDQTVHQLQNIYHDLSADAR